MNNFVSCGFGQFDYVWPPCAFKHLGSLDHGLKFAEKSTDYAKSGGLVVYTMELNLGASEQTQEDGGTVINHKRNIEELA